MLHIDAAAVEAARARATAELVGRAAELASGRGANARVIAWPGTCLAYAWPASPFNAAIGLGLDGAAADGALDRVGRFFAEVDARAAAAVELADAVDKAWLEALAGRGYRLRDVLYTWGRAVTAADGSFADARVRPARPDEAERWSLTVARAFGEGADPSAADVDTARLIALHAHSRLFLALVDGEAVAGAVVGLDGDMAHLYSGATLPAHRGRGLQRALVQARLAFAAARGCRLATTQTDPAGTSRRNMERAGFTFGYTLLQFERPAGTGTD